VKNRGADAVATAGVPRIALTRREAAAALGIGLDSFERHVQPELGLIRRGRLVLVPVAELERWAESRAERTLP
jgi:excisionase family DNA binding protein